MTKAFDDSERKQIKNRLKKGALKYLQEKGIRKTSVDELVRYANISKGAFYLFYESKELLFFESIADYHNHLQKEFLNALNKHAHSITIDQLTTIISDFLINNKPFLTSIFSNTGDVEYLSRKLPPSLLSKHADDDTLLVNELLKFIPREQTIDPNVLAGALRSVFLSILNEEAIGKDIFNEVLRFSVRGAVLQLFDPFHST